MSLDQALQDAVSKVPEAVASGFIDVDSGMLLGVKTVDSHPNEVIDLLAAATSDLFQGTTVREIETIFQKMRGTADDFHYFQEIIVNSENLVHVFLRSKEHPSYVLCIVCRISVNLGMALTMSRKSMAACEAAM